MAVLKCKMCGGDLNIIEAAGVGECEFCGTRQTIPTGDDDKKTNLFNRANHLRISCEFDRATALFENIVNEFPREAEAYWGLVLCKYGIEYVDDPLTGRKIPTCHRTSYESIFEDINYKQAVEIADTVAADVYRTEAEAINNIQRGILDIVKNEKPFDVFICYKESDDAGNRTQDSVLAQELYYQLDREGFKVFFARITLEGKLGTAYEPYIFAALNSAKVMVVLGTKPEHFNAVWVKNEWSRYLDMMRQDKSKTLIPAYRDMDPYDLPDALSMYQALDMSKLGFMQDLIHGINKLAGAKEEAPVNQVQTVTSHTSSGVENYLKRGNLSLEDGKWEEADSFFEQALNEDAECALAYLGKLMAELRLKNTSWFEYNDFLFTDNANYQKAYRFADDDLKQTLLSYVDSTLSVKGMLIAGGAEKDPALENQLKAYIDAKEVYSLINDPDIRSEKIEECNKNIESYRLKIKNLKQISYYSFVDALKKYEAKFREEYDWACRVMEYPQHLSELEKAYSILKSHRYVGYKSAGEWLNAYEGIKIYMAACDYMAKTQFVEYQKLAIKLFKELGDYRDSVDRIKVCESNIEKLNNVKKENIYITACRDATACMSTKQKEEYTLKGIVEAFEGLEGYKDSREWIERCQKCIRDIERVKKWRAIIKKAVVALVVLTAIGVAGSKAREAYEAYEAKVEAEAAAEAAEVEAAAAEAAAEAKKAAGAKYSLPGDYIAGDITIRISHIGGRLVARQTNDDTFEALSFSLYEPDIKTLVYTNKSGQTYVFIDNSQLTITGTDGTTRTYIRVQE